MDCFFIALKCRVCDFFRTFRFSRFLHVSFFKSSTFRFAGFSFWIRDLKTGKYWKKDNHDFDLNFGLYSACNRRISHGRTYIIVIYKGVITVYDWHDSMVFVSIDKILKELKYSPLDRLKTLENVLNAKISTHIFEQPLIQKKINLR